MFFSKFCENADIEQQLVEGKGGRECWNWSFY